jgi:hypothetical protein
MGSRQRHTKQKQKQNKKASKKKQKKNKKKKKKNKKQKTKKQKKGGRLSCTYIKVIVRYIIQSSSRTGLTLGNIHISNDKGFFHSTYIFFLLPRTLFFNRFDYE